MIHTWSIFRCSLKSSMLFLSFGIDFEQKSWPSTSMYLTHHNNYHALNTIYAHYTCNKCVVSIQLCMSYTLNCATTSKAQKSISRHDTHKKKWLNKWIWEKTTTTTEAAAAVVTAQKLFNAWNDFGSITWHKFCARIFFSFIHSERASKLVAVHNTSHC